MRFKVFISFSFIALLLCSVALPLALSIVNDTCMEMTECGMEEDETEEEERVPSNRLLEEDIESISRAEHRLVFQTLNNTKHISYIKYYVTAVFDVPTEPPEFKG